MAQVEAALFTVGVFKDLAWAERGIDALKQQGFAAERMTLAAKASPEAAALIERALGAAPASMDLPVVGAAVARGTLADTLNGPGRDLAQDRHGGRDEARRIPAARRADLRDAGGEGRRARRHRGRPARGRRAGRDAVVRRR